MLDTPLMLVELSVMQQRYQAVSFVNHDGESVVEVARRFNVTLTADRAGGGRAYLFGHVVG